MVTHRLNRLPIGPEVISAIEAAIQARGWCIGGYAQVEFIMADFVVKASALPGYQDLGVKFPYNFDARVKRLREFADREGVLKSYSEPLRQLAEAISSWEETRHFLTHGWMEIRAKTTVDPQPTFTFSRFMPRSGNDRFLGQIDMTLEDLQTTGDQISTLADEALKMFDDIYTLFNLEGGKHTF
jgi:hypothetical protein